MSLRETCKCGHDKDTHFKDLQSGQRGRCTGLHCNDCFAYRDASVPSTIPPTQRSGALTPRAPSVHRRPHADSNCTCKACRDWARATHYRWCTCHLCLG